MRHVSCFLCDGDRVFLTYSTTGRGTEAARGSLALPDMTPYGRGAALADQPGRLARGARPVLVLALGRGRERRLGCGQPPGAAVHPPRRDPAETPGRHGHHH
jgi:hypothetical protein